MTVVVTTNPFAVLSMNHHFETDCFIDLVMGSEIVLNERIHDHVLLKVDAPDTGKYFFSQKRDDRCRTCTD